MDESADDVSMRATESQQHQRQQMGQGQVRVGGMVHLD
jgi:hypothetical protein